jgi:hypothetical protein
MGKKLYISVIGGLAPLLGVAAFAMTPATAQATTCQESFEKSTVATGDATEPAGYNKNLLGGTPTPATESCYHFFGNSTTPPSKAGREFCSQTNGTKCPTVAWSEALTLTNETTGGNVTCKNVIGGWVVNPGTGETANGPPGMQETQAWGAFECESNACFPGVGGSGPDTYIGVQMEPWDEPTLPLGRGTDAPPFPATINNETTVGEEYGSLTNLDWKGHLVPPSGGGTRARLLTEGIRVNVTCHINTGFDAEGEPTYTNSSEVSTGSNMPENSVTKLTPKNPPELLFAAGSGTLTNGSGQKGKTTGSIKNLNYENQTTINVGLG